MFSQARELRRQDVQRFGDGRRATGIFRRAVGETAERRGNFDRDCHFVLLKFVGQTFAASAAAPSCASRYVSNASIRGAMASVSGYSATIASVVFRPLPVTQTTVV